MCGEMSGIAALVLRCEVCALPLEGWNLIAEQDRSYCILSGSDQRCQRWLPLCTRNHIGVFPH